MESILRVQITGKILGTGGSNEYLELREICCGVKKYCLEDANTEVVLL